MVYYNELRIINYYQLNLQYIFIVFYCYFFFLGLQLRYKIIMVCVLIGLIVVFFRYVLFMDSYLCFGDYWIIVYRNEVIYSLWFIQINNYCL